MASTYKAVVTLHKEAAKNYSKTSVSDDGDIYLVWDDQLSQYLRAIENTFGESEGSTVTKDVVELLRGTQYAITDRRCFPEPPANEEEVHARIEAVLRCVFPDLRHKPRIGKPIRNFEPDTGLPSIRTLIEYKFISNDKDAKRVAPELLADSRGYVSKEWDRFIYVVYETHRVRRETEWNELMRASGLRENTRVVVISGEPTRRMNRTDSEQRARAGTSAAIAGRLKRNPA